MCTKEAFCGCESSGNARVPQLSNSGKGMGPSWRTMPTEHGFRFDDLQRVENVGSQREPAKTHRSMLEKAKRPGDWCRSTGISAYSSARDRKSLAKAHHINLQRSIIARKHQPIRAVLPAGLGFRQGRRWHDLQRHRDEVGEARSGEEAITHQVALRR
jgi:hypothetical protein